MCCKNSNSNSNRQQMREARRHARGPPCSRRSHSHAVVVVDQPAPSAPVVFSRFQRRQPVARAAVGNDQMLVHVQHLNQSRHAAHQQQAAYNAPVQAALEPTRQSRRSSGAAGAAGSKEERERERERERELAYAARWKSEKKREPMQMRREMRGERMDDGLPPSYAEVMKQQQQQQA
ncbi:uncharacterized protein L3040_004806 [Drepanopeziza brunnea f. sp. 'multigermtubi']|uniref:Uncharacterized protein n=1 Tax=Marssonina brunnea f. sp. multigermtubi (strain MB_m1) TaxID=1072389 RepID=K1WVC8_MARBU|nr:uncharacterized protein MBM_00693 [Drepanopeziza brunnea f. sp. 'multigermtubi' MB_m1]EKD21580.1 hypothetical protein MBM_00693 [Drepanopeziza brunnea f. sp. 'multigermtubi' MB_m1]KAJ5042252.1 hypothetical protein L3040_004806 [Drepanopeziza brunnea f. sp. 'multigermtubi']